MLVLRRRRKFWGLSIFWIDFPLYSTHIWWSFSRPYCILSFMSQIYWKNSDLKSEFSQVWILKSEFFEISSLKIQTLSLKKNGLVHIEVWAAEGRPGPIFNHLSCGLRPPPPCYSTDEKIKIFKCAETLKNEVFRPAAGGNLWGPKPIMDYTPLVIDRFLTRGV